MARNLSHMETKNEARSDYAAVEEGDQHAPLRGEALVLTTGTSICPPMRLRRIPRSSQAVTAVTVLLAVVAAAVWVSTHRGVRGQPHAGSIGSVITAAAAQCSPMDQDTKYFLTVYKHVFGCATPEDCCGSCSGDPKCGLWTYKSTMKMCSLMQKPAGVEPRKVSAGGFVSGVKSGDGSAPAPSSEGGALPSGIAVGPHGKCSGTLKIAGYGEVSLIATGANKAGPSSNLMKTADDNTSIVATMGGRAYMGESCKEGPYTPTEYANIKLLGKRMRYTVDISGTQCGCNAAFYLSPMRGNNQVGKCSDYYCDAMSVCGVACAEIDIQEANQLSWFSTLHGYHPKWGPDKLGLGSGYGGSAGVPDRRDWTSVEYGVGVKCIDTSKPFNVSVGFPVDAKGLLTSMDMELTQGAKTCPLSARTDQYVLKWPGIKPWDGMKKIHDTLWSGVTPVVSYWSSKDMLWLDGPGKDGKGPCTGSNIDECSKSVKFSDFSISDYDGKEFVAQKSK